MSIVIEKPDPSEADELTKVAIAAKKHWGYPDEWIELWQDELTYTPAIISSRDVYVGRDEVKIVFVYSVQRLSRDEYDLEGCWIDPRYIGQGYGRILFEHLETTLKSLGCTKLVIVSDPNAEGFYRKMGAVPVGERPSIPEGRVLPVLEYEIKQGLNGRRLD